MEDATGAARTPRSQMVRPSSTSHRVLPARPRSCHSARSTTLSGPPSRIAPTPPTVPQGLSSRVSNFVSGVAYTRLVQEHLQVSGDPFKGMASTINQCALAYQHMLQSTRELTFPNPLRTSFCCAVIDQLFTPATLHDSSDLADVLKADIFASLYHNTTPDLFLPSQATKLDSTLSRFKAHSLYFTELEITATERDDMLSEIQAKRLMNTKEIALMERIIQRWQAMVTDRLFSAWRFSVSRKKRWLNVLDDDFKAVRSTRVLRRSFVAWKEITRFSRVGQQLHNSLARNKEQEENEEGLLREYAKLVAGIESLKSDKQALQDSVRRFQDEIGTLKITVDQLQARLDQQRVTTGAWRDAAMQLCRFVSHNTPAPSDTDDLVNPVPLIESSSAMLRMISSNVVSPQSSHLFPLGESPSSSRTPGAIIGFPIHGSSNGSPTRQSPESPSSGGDWEEKLLVWLNSTLHSTRSCSSATPPYVSTADSLHKGGSRGSAAGPQVALDVPCSLAAKRIPFVQNFTDDFRDGAILLELVELLGVVPASDMASFRTDRLRNQAEPNLVSLRFSLPALASWCKFPNDVPLEPLDVATGNAAESLRLLVAHLMASFSPLRCPLCSPFVDNPFSSEAADGGSSHELQKKSSATLGVTTVADLHRRVTSAMHHHQNRRAELHSVLEKAWSSLHPVEKRALPNDLLLNHVVQDATSKQQLPREKVEELLEQFRLLGRNHCAEIQRAFGIISCSEEEVHVDTWLKVMHCCRAVFRFPIKRLSGHIVTTAPVDQRSRHHVVNVTTWTALMLHSALLNALVTSKQSLSDAVPLLESELLRIINGIENTNELLARQEVNIEFSLPHVSKVFRDSTSTLGKIWSGTSPTVAGITQERFLQILKECGKCLDKHCTADCVKRVFALFVDSESSLMTFEEFGKSLLCVALWKDSSPLVHSGVKFKRLIDEFTARDRTKH